MIYIPTIWCHPENDGFPFEPGSSQESQELFLTAVTSGLLITNLDLVHGHLSFVTQNKTQISGC